VLVVIGVEETPVERRPGPRCPRCLGALTELADLAECELCGSTYGPGPRHRTLAVGTPNPSFAQELDAVVDSLEPLLDGLAPPSCTEAVIARHAEEHGIEIGNPVWEGRFDIARALPQASGTVLDLGCGFGTGTVALARSAAHVIAIDPSPQRVRLTAARLHAEGLKNATVVQADALELGLATDSFDLVTVIGVLEWLSHGSADPLRTQRRVLAEVSRVLKPGGVLLLGIENRFSAHYFGGLPEEHIGLRFVSLLPRPLGDVYARLAGRGRVTTYTHSRVALLRLLREAGLEPRLGLALPSYHLPQFVFDEASFRRAWTFYLRHVFHYSSTERRVVGALVAHAPPAAKAFAPSFFAVARKNANPDPLPTTVTGTPDCRRDSKAIDWSRNEIRFRPRLRSGPVRVQPLVRGWNGRRWVSAPLRTGERRRRELHLLRSAVPILRRRPERADDRKTYAQSLEEAKQAVDQLEVYLEPEVSAWHRAELSAIAEGEPVVVVEHGDFVTGNLVVRDDGEIAVLDASGGWAVPGRDSVLLALDLFGVRLGAKAPDVDAGFTSLARAARAGEAAAAVAADMLDEEIGLRQDARRASRLFLVAILRHYGTRTSLNGVRTFAARAADGELLALLEDLRAQLRSAAR
jgi:SAM-dependent methyltransferase